MTKLICECCNRQVVQSGEKLFEERWFQHMDKYDDPALIPHDCRKELESRIKVGERMNELQKVFALQCKMLEESGKVSASDLEPMYDLLYYSSIRIDGDLERKNLRRKLAELPAGYEDQAS